MRCHENLETLGGKDSGSDDDIDGDMDVQAHGAHNDNYMKRS